MTCPRDRTATGRPTKCDAAPAAPCSLPTVHCLSTGSHVDEKGDSNMPLSASLSATCELNNHSMFKVEGPGEGANTQAAGSTCTGQPSEPRVPAPQGRLRIEDASMRSGQSSNLPNVPSAKRLKGPINTCFSPNPSRKSLRVDPGRWSAVARSHLQFTHAVGLAKVDYFPQTFPGRRCLLFVVSRWAPQASARPGETKTKRQASTPCPIPTS